MPNPALAAVGRVARALDPDPPADADLLTRFVETRDEASFAELLRRHGPTVLGTCRRILFDPHDADDAFQAVFVVLARRAGSIRPPGQVGPWLYGVAVKTATKAKIMAAKRRQRDLASGGVYPRRPDDPPDWSDVRPVIDAELARLPEKLRAAVVLCDLGGKSRSEAARELGVPEGTVATRLAKARELLAARLTRRGVTLSAAGVAALLAPGAASAVVPEALASAALAAALGPSASAVPPSVLTLADKVVRSMYASYWKLGAVAAVVLGGLAAGGVAVTAGGGPADPPANKAAALPAADPPPTVERNEDLWTWNERPRPDGDGQLVRSVAFTPDGKALVAGRSDGMVNLWPVAPGRLRYTWAAAGGWTAGTLAAVAVSPDGSTVAVAHRDGVQLLDAATGTPTDALREGRSDPTAVAFSPDGKRVAFTNGFQLWVSDRPPQSGGTNFGPLAQVAKTDPKAAVAFSPDGKRVVFLPNTKIDPNDATTRDPAKATHWYAQIWGAGSGESMAFLKHGTARITTAAWSADGTTIATADVDGGIALWDGKTLAEKARVKAPGGVTALAIRADGKRVAVGVTGAKPKDPTDPNTAPQVVVFTEWEPAKNWLESSWLGGPPAETVRSLAFSPDGKVLAAGAVGGLRVWDRVFVKAASK